VQLSGYLITENRGNKVPCLSFAYRKLLIADKVIHDLKEKLENDT
jgi:hypothetical protein